MFSGAVDASKVALVDLVDRLRGAGYGLLDVQWATPHLRALGVIEVPRPRYVVALQEAREVEVADAW
jgi:leucyl/phenylalanyl-tRNA--protein transferase